MLYLTILIIGILTGAEVDLFIPSFPELQKIYDLSPFLVQLTLSVNFIAYCVCSLFAGALGDRYNRRTVILVSLAVFVVGSLFCVFSMNYSMLIVGRFLQGAGMAGPAVMGYVIIADQYPIEKQAAMLGTLNGMVTLMMALAPVLGSYVNLYFSWRGNFVILLGLGIVCLILGYFVIPYRAGDKAVSLSPKTYLPLLASKKLMTFVWGIGFLVVPYWVFIGMAPILYMEDMGVDIRHFGFYQGAIAGVFSVVSIFSPKILERFGQMNCLSYSKKISFVAAIGALIMTLLDVHHPLIITGLMLVFAGAVVFPINILYPLSLELVENAKSRTAALIQGLRLLLTAFFLELISYFYTGKFMPIGLAIFFTTMISLLFIRKIFHRGWAKVPETVATAPMIH
jgi:DHA1 family bicyclomycin/chloramphenicol resistance-like MFS transporter